MFVRVVPYNHLWETEYKTEAQKLRNILKDILVGIYHIGSTAVKGLSAKPIIDIMPGVQIGDGAIIAANSVVVKDIPPYHIAGGNPCKIIKKRFDDELVNYLLAIKWWDWSARKIFDNLETLCSGDLTKIKEIK